ncbi:MAG: chain-length determining protein, partial [Paraprevotella sp.]|nr:chain-length determining protein [Paraprevotella sp.]
MENKSYQSYDSAEEQESGFNYRAIIDAVILNWYWFVLSLVVCVVAALLYLRYQSPVYNSYTKVLIKEDDPYKRARSSSMADFSQLGLVTNSYGFDNELEVISSKVLARRAVTN